MAAALGLLPPPGGLGAAARLPRRLLPGGGSGGSSSGLASSRLSSSSGGSWQRTGGSGSSSSVSSSRSVGPRRRRCVATTHAALVPASIVGAAARAAAAVPALLAGAIDPAVLAATVNASGKLFLVCAAVGWLLRTGRIPNSTATVMSQVSFQLLIPCMLFSKVGATLASNPDPRLLAGIAAAAVLQILLGAAAGLLLAPMFGLSPSQLAAQQQQQGQPGQQGQQQWGGSSWRGRSSPEAASAIALSMAAASGTPRAAAALRPKQPPPPAGAHSLRFVGCWSRVSNSFTLPAIFFATMLPPAMADRALGYAALFLLAWSPCLWSVGLSLVGGGQPSPAAAAAREGRGLGGAAQQARQAQQLRPLNWRQPGVVDVTPLSSGSLSSSDDPSSSGGSSSGGSTASPSELSSSNAVAAAAAARLPPPPTWAERLARHPALSRLLAFAGQVLNPPVLAILAGAAAGFSPLGRALLASASGAGGAVALPPELGLLHGTLRAALEVVELLAAGTLATQTLVLAASLLQQPEEPEALAAASVGVAGAAKSGGWQRRGWLSAARRGLLPSDSLEARALAVLALTRFVVVPLGTIAVLQALAAGGLLPPVLSDPLLLFVLLVEACMPSAQNLIILLQLTERTRGAAPSFARLLLKLYALAVVPVTLWVSAFATNLGLRLR